MSLAQEFEHHMRAGFSGLWIRSHEPDEAVSEIAAVCRGRWQLAEFDLARGLVAHDELVSLALQTVKPDTSKITSVLSSWPELAKNIHQHALAAAKNDGPEAVTRVEGTQKAILVLHNVHRDELLGKNSLLIQAIYNLVRQGRTQEGRFAIVITANQVRLPDELVKQFTVLEHPLPSKDELLEIAKRVAPDDDDLAKRDDLDKVLESAAGLTATEAENAFALSYIKQRPFDPALLWELKAQALKKSGLLTVYQGDASFEKLGGMHQFEEFVVGMLKRPAANPRLRPKGVICLGVQGSGKSQAIKALGHATGRKVLYLDVGTLMGGIVGQTESNTRQVIELAEAMSPCILLMDEVEKALAGASGSGSNDSGVSKRMFGTLLTWLQDKKSDVFVCATSNNIDLLPPEFRRAGRFDAMFFFDLPGQKEREAIWKIYLAEFGFDVGKAAEYAKRVDWTGAEIEQACRLAAMHRQSIDWAASLIVPIAISASETVQALRKWADGRCLAAGSLGLYRSEGVTTAKKGPKRSLQN